MGVQMAFPWDSAAVKNENYAKIKLENQNRGALFRLFFASKIFLESLPFFEETPLLLLQGLLLDAIWERAHLNFWNSISL